MTVAAIQTLAAASRTLIAFGALVAVVQLMLLPTLRTAFRQDLFDIRNRLFLFMVDGNTAPNDAAYTQLRSLINGLIQYSERFTFLRLIPSVIVSARVGHEFDRKMKMKMAAHSPEVQQQFLAFYKEVDRVISRHLIRTSPILWMMWLVVQVVRLLERDDTFAAKTKRDVVKAIEADVAAEVECLAAA